MNIYPPSLFWREFYVHILYSGGNEFEYRLGRHLSLSGLTSLIVWAVSCPYVPIPIAAVMTRSEFTLLYPEPKFIEMVKIRKRKPLTKTAPIELQH